MSVHVVGDLQGCLTPLRQLLDRVAFDPAKDRLWLVGDLVNRGPDSLACLQFVRDLGDAAICVLGNHDLHLLAVHHGVSKPRKRDTLDGILASPDREALMDWLRSRPLMHHDADLGWTMVHAGLPPQWDLDTALTMAAEIQERLRGQDCVKLLKHMYGNDPDQWNPRLKGWRRLRFGINCFTRMRYCTEDGRLDLDFKLAPGNQPRHLMPWFSIPQRASRNLRIVVGHWSTLGYGYTDGVLSLDTGCVWGRALTMVQLDNHDLPLHQIDCAQKLRPQG